MAEVSDQRDEARALIDAKKCRLDIERPHMGNNHPHSCPRTLLMYDLRYHRVHRRIGPSTRIKRDLHFPHLARELVELRLLQFHLCLCFGWRAPHSDSQRTGYRNLNDCQAER